MVTDPSLPVFSKCSGNDIPDHPVLIEVEFVRSGASAGELWVAGECGRVWRYVSGAWTEYKSQTDTNISGISFPSASTGFFVGYRFAATGQALVRYE